MKSKHKNVFKKYQERKGNLLSGIQKKIVAYTKNDSTTVKLSKTGILEGMVQLVTVDGRPFSSVEDEGIRQAFGTAFQKLDFSLDRHNITELVKFAAIFIVDEIKKLLKATLISVKVDCATRIYRLFLGLNVQVKSKFQLNLIRRIS